MTSLLDALDRSEQERLQHSALEPTGDDNFPQVSEFSSVAVMPAQAIKPRLSAWQFVLAGLLLGMVLFATASYFMPVFHVNASQSGIDARQSERLDMLDLQQVTERAPAERVEPELTESAERTMAAILATEVDPETEPTVIEAVVTARPKSGDEVSFKPAPRFITQPLRDKIITATNVAVAQTSLPESLAESPVVIDAEPAKATEPQSAAAKKQHDEYDLDGVSPELALAFQQAITATDNQPAQPKKAKEVSADLVAIPIDELPQQLKATLPNLSYSSHVYSSDPARRKVKLNGQLLQEGEWLGDAIEVLQIMPDIVILRHKGQSFSLEALTDWPY